MMTRASAWKAWFVLVGVIAFFNASCGKRELEPTPPEPARPAAGTRPALEFRPVSGAGQDIQEAHLTTQLLPQLRSRLEILTIVVQAGKPVTLPSQYEGVLELRAGSLTTGIEDSRQARHRGAMWQVAKGERVTLQASGELAVVRAVYLVPGEK
ncbi:MAG TPA: hypothetical protein VFB28_00245 [Terriglobales bacterium]|nr:hypothetical protein [Terriglobales bacterium]